MAKVAVIGECMIELFEKEPTLYKQTFGGDSFNCAAYLKQMSSDSEVEYITLLGDDELSSKMLSFFKQQGVSVNYVKQLANKFAGLYMIHTDNGERSFSYYRDSSAAKELFVNENYEDLISFDMIYFSAVSLAILSEAGRTNLYKTIKKARKVGVKIAFDSNYRVKLYKNKQEAKDIYEEALSHCDIFLPSIDDEKALFEYTSKEEIIHKALKYGCSEIVIKCGSENVTYYENGKVNSIEVNKLTKIVDSTSAGDSFNGAYLASRLQNLSIKDSIQKASVLASKVIMHKGAIIPKEILK